MSKEKFVYIGVLLFSILFLIFGNRLMDIDIRALSTRPIRPYFTGVVTEILSREEVTTGDNGLTDTTIIFDVRLADRGRRGDVVTARQHLSDFTLINEREVTIGDRVLLVYFEHTGIYRYVNYVRIHYIAILGAIFSLLVILFGRKKGLDALIALSLTCFAILFVFVPAIFMGKNIYLATIIICIYSIISTLLLVIGFNKKAASAMIGCLGGIFLAAILMFVMNHLLGLTGAWNNELLRIARLPTEIPINMSGLIFAGVILGALGAIMDVAMSIASSTWEVKQAQKIPYKLPYGNSIYKAGINIGKDLLGTSLNSLILAYIGTSLSMIILIMSSTPSFTLLFNREMIIVELLRALIGSFGMLLTIPLTAIVCDWLYASSHDYEMGFQLANERKSMDTTSSGRPFYFGVLILSIVFLFVGNRIASSDLEYQDYNNGVIYYTGIVIQIIEHTEENDRTTTTFDVRLTDGERSGDIVAAERRTGFLTANVREIREGNRVIIRYDDSRNVYFFLDHIRINLVVALGVVFLVLVLAFCRQKGFNSVLALALTCMAVILIFVPAILSGKNVFITAIIVCSYSTISTLLIINGASRKALSAILGCLVGILSSGIIMLIMNILLRLTGAVDTETEVLLLLPLDNPINLRAIIFAGIIFGAVGAIMDVAISIASSLWEVNISGGISDFKSIVKSGIIIGRDLLGTMFNTLILAYIGSSLSMVMIVMMNNTSTMELFSREIIVVEFLRALIGGFGMLLTIPLTAVICGWLYAITPE